MSIRDKANDRREAIYDIIMVDGKVPTGQEVVELAQEYDVTPWTIHDDIRKLKVSKLSGKVLDMVEKRLDEGTDIKDADLFRLLKDILPKKTEGTLDIKGEIKVQQLSVEAALEEYFEFEEAIQGKGQKKNTVVHEEYSEQ